MSTACSPASSSSSSSILNVIYSLAAKYTGSTTNTLVIDAEAGSDEDFEFSLSNATATPSIDQDVFHPLVSQSVTFTYSVEGVYSADFRVNKKNGQPYIHEVLSWEYSDDPPEPPIISFANEATKVLANTLIISDTRTPTTSAIWVGGDVDLEGKENVVDGGYWSDLGLTDVVLPIKLTTGDGVKSIQAKFKNVFGNVSEAAVPAEIILKQTAPTDCAATPLSSTISNNKLSLKMNATDPYQLYYSVIGDLAAAVSRKPFSDGETVFVYLEQTEGSKSITVYIEDIAGNNCLEKPLTITIDADYESEGIWVDDHPYWTDDENIVVDVFFDHFPDQEPLQIKITGDVTGANTFRWMDYEQDIPITLNPATSGSRQIFAQYKDVNGDESYLIGKRIFLKPQIVLQDMGGFYNVVASQIPGIDSITIVGCNESYVDVPYAATYTCNPNAASVDLTYKFEDGSTHTESATP